MVINKMLYKLDEEGYFINYEDVDVEFNPETKDISNIPKGYALKSWTQQNPKQRWFKPKFVNGKWVESLTEEEIREYDKEIVKESKPKEELVDLQLQIKQLQQSNAELMNLIATQGIAPK